jgi:hypothetical protein
VRVREIRDLLSIRERPSRGCGARGGTVVSVKWGRQGRLRGELSQHGRAQQAHSLPDNCPQPQRQEQHRCHRHPIRPTLAGGFPDRWHRRLIDFGVGALQQTLLSTSSSVIRCSLSLLTIPPPHFPMSKGGAFSARGVDALAGPPGTAPPVEARRRRNEQRRVRRTVPTLLCTQDLVGCENPSPV